MSDMAGGRMKNKMTPKRQQALQQTLHALREKEIIDIEKELGREIDPALIGKIDSPMDFGELASQETSEGIDRKILERRYKTYKDIADAFRRLEAGTYGVCENCGAEIPLKRLNIEPVGRYCVPCLNNMEKFEEAEKGIHKTLYMGSSNKIMEGKKMKKPTEKKMLQTEKRSSPELSIELHDIDLQKNDSQSLRERISEAAYDLFLKRGAAHGHELDDWLEGERLVLDKLGNAKSESNG